MVNFIVSGQIPGTHLQLTFLFWQVVFSGIIAFAVVNAVRRLKRSETTSGEDEAAQQTTQTA